MSPPAFVPSTPTPGLVTRTPVLAATTSVAPLTLPSAPSTTIVPALATALAGARLASRPRNPPPAAAASGTVVVLFRSDLRVDDHAPLVHACEEAAVVVPVVCFDPRHFGRTAYGFEKTGRYRACFLIESVRALRDSFRAMGAEIVVRVGRPEEVVVDVCKKVGAKRVFLHAETTYEEQQLEGKLKEAVKAAGGEVQTFWGNALYHTDDVPFDLMDVPDIYTDFRQAVEKRGEIRAPLDAPKALAPLPAAIDVGDIPSLRDLAIDEGTDTVSTSSSSVASIEGGEPEGRRRVRTYVGEARAADAGGDGMRGVAHLGADFSCRISPWLALGCVSPRRIYAEMKAACGGNEAGLAMSPTYFELVWRDFFRFITCKYSRSRIGKATGSTVRSSPMAAAAGV